MFACCCAPKGDDKGVTIPSPGAEGAPGGYGEEDWEGGDEAWGWGEDENWEEDWGEDWGEEVWEEAEPEAVHEFAEKAANGAEVAAKADGSAKAEAAAAATAPAPEVPAAPQKAPAPAQKEVAAKAPEPEPAAPKAPPPRTRAISRGGTSFTVELVRKSENSPWGMAVDLAGARAIHVCSVSHGDTPMGLYNSKAPPDKRVHPGDYVVAVNGKSAAKDGSAGDSEELSAAMRTSLKVELLVERPHVYRSTVNKGTDAIGLDLSYNSRGIGLVVVGVLDGAVKKQAPEIIPGDRIMSVNDMKGQASQLLNAMRNMSDQVDLILSRCLHAHLEEKK